MAHFWRERNHGRRFGDRAWSHPRLTSDLDPRTDICVKVCSFTFHFESVDEIDEYINFYSQTTHPSSRRPMPEGMDSFARWHAQRWFERLPLDLQEEPKREKVLKALHKAKHLVEIGKV